MHSENMKYFSKFSLENERVPISSYLVDYFERERDNVFKRVWLSTGHRVDSLKTPGDYVILDLPLFNTSLLIVRGTDNILRGFHNVCTHRGNQLVWNERGCQPKFFCNFHGWTFDTRGHLTNAPGGERISGFEKREHGLAEIAIDTWEGFVFFNLDAKPQLTLLEYLGEWGEGLEGYPFSDLQLVGSYRAVVNANWKIMLDAFQEGFHVPFLHARSAPDAGMRNNPLADALDIKLFTIHRMLSFPSNQRSVVYGREGQAGMGATLPPVTKTITPYINVSRDQFAPKNLPQGINPTRSKDWSFDINVVYPNWWLAMRGDHVHTYNFWPHAHDITEYVVKFYYPSALTVKEKLAQDLRMIRVRNTLMEDLSTVERIQRHLRSGAREYFLLSDEEAMIKHNYEVTERLLACNSTDQVARLIRERS